MNPIIWVKFAWDFVAKVILKHIFKEKPHDQGIVIQTKGDFIGGDRISGDKVAGNKVTNLNLSTVSEGISDEDIKEAKGDLINFLNKLLDSKSENIADALTYEYENVIGATIEMIGNYRFNKLFPFLNSMKIANFKWGANNNLIGASFHSVNYSKKDVESMILDIEKGVYDKYLRQSI